MNLSVSMSIVLSVLMAGLLVWMLLMVRRYLKTFKAAKTTIRQLTENQMKLKNRLAMLENELLIAAQDSATALPSWTLFQSYLRQAISESVRYELNFALMFVDIDGFDLIHSALGEEASDELLKVIAERIGSCIRKTDCLSRYHHNVFAVLLTQLATPEKAAIVAERIAAEFSQAFKFKDREIWLSVCIGITVYPNDGSEATTLIANAQQALSRAKGVNQTVFQFYQEQMSKNSQRELILSAEFNQESVVDDFQLQFEPVLDVVAEKIVSMDARLQWLHHHYGLIGEDELQGLMDQYRKRNAYTLFLLRQAAQQYRHWHSLGLEGGLLVIPLEQSQLKDTQFIYEFSNTLNGLQFDPKKVRLKIRASQHQEQEAVFEKSINRLQYLGVSLALDCANQRILSLQLLKEYGFDAIYLDEDLFEGCVDSERTQQFMVALRKFAEELSLDIILTNMTNGLNLSMLQELGFTKMQGRQMDEQFSGSIYPADMLTI